MGAGRPTSYKEEYCDRVIECLRSGLGLSSFAAEIGVCHDTLNEWAKVHPEFSAAKKVAMCAKTAAWERKALLPKDDPARTSDATIIFMLKNACPTEYKERHEEKERDDSIAARMLEGCSTETLSAIARDLANKPQ